MLQLGILRALALAVLLAAPNALARAGRGYSPSGGSHHGWSSYSHPSSSHGKIKRDPAQRRAFESQHACPSTGRTSGACPGFVVDHVVPLKRGGKDAPNNMQWQTRQAAKEKDRLE